MPRPAGRWLETAYRLSLLAKGALGLTQSLGGLGLWLAPQGALARLIDWLTRNELAQDPTDLIVTRLRSWADHLSVQSEHFYALYLLGHGALNLGVVLALLLRIPGSYHVSMAVLAGFVCYQLYDFAIGHDPALLVLTAIDLVVIALVWLERRASRHPR